MFGVCLVGLGRGLRLGSWRCGLLLGLFLQVVVGCYGYAAVAVVGQHLVHYCCDLLLQLVDELPCVVFLVLNVAQLFLPDARQFAAFKQLFLDYSDEFDARRRGNYALAFAPYVVSFEQSFDDVRPRRRPPDAVLFQGGAQLFVVYELSGRLHRAEQRRLGVVWGRSCPLLGQRRLVGAALSLGEGRQGALLVLAVGVVCVVLRRVFRVQHAPSRVKYLLAADLELHIVHTPGGGGC